MYIQLKISKVRGTGEFKVVYKEDRKINENKSYYTDDEEDAVNTFVSMYNAAREKYGKNNVGWAWTDLTDRLLKKYNMANKLGPELLV